MSISCIIIKKCDDYQYQSVERFSVNTLTWDIFLIHCTSYKNKLIWIHKYNKLNTFNYQKLFYIKHFCDIFLTKIHLFHRPYVLILLERALFIKRKPFLLSYKEFSIIFIINGPLNIDWLASFSSYKILIGLFKLNEKPVKLLLTACYWL